MTTRDSKYSFQKRMEIEALRPEEVGMSLKGLNRINELIQQAIQRRSIPGAVGLIARKGHTVYLNSLGMNSLESNQSLKKDDIFVIASMTKAITSVAVMMLYEEGKFELDTPIADFIPEFRKSTVIQDFDKDQLSYTTQPLKQTITIRHLLNHTSGIGYAFLDARLRALNKKLGGISPHKTLRENMPYFAQLPLLHQPGESWTYGYSTDILGYLIEQVSKMTLDQFFEKKIFKPLLMNDTHFHLPPEKFDRYTTRYLKTLGNHLVALPKTLPDKSRNLFLSGGGGLLSTAFDYGRFLQMLLQGGTLDGKKILSPASIQLMTRNQIDRHHAYEKEFPFLNGLDKFGLGFMIYTPESVKHRKINAGSYGWAGSYNTWYWVDPKAEMYGILLTQVIPFSDQESVRLYEQFQDLTYEAML
ncbi:MAG: serine hydrolase domain-containing protein [Microscillaceae bacterium]|nr:serine hydrolase domain-containing protein [Microscillaceae bacterium]